MSYNIMFCTIMISKTILKFDYFINIVYNKRNFRNYCSFVFFISKYWYYDE